MGAGDVQIPVGPGSYPLEDVKRVLGCSDRFGEFGRARLDSTPMRSHDERCAGESRTNLIIRALGFTRGEMIEILVSVTPHCGRLQYFALLVRFCRSGWHFYMAPSARPEKSSARNRKQRLNKGLAMASLPRMSSSGAISRAYGRKSGCASWRPSEPCPKTALRCIGCYYPAIRTIPACPALA